MVLRFSAFPNISSSILHVQEQMWIQNDLWGLKQCICANPSGNHCTQLPCKAYVQHWDTFAPAQYLGRERLGAEWIQDHGAGEAGKIMEPLGGVKLGAKAWKKEANGSVSLSSW